MSAPHEPGQQCDAAIALAFTVLGKRWNGMIIDALSHGPVGFSSLRRAVPGISDAVLSDRLSELTSVGLVRRDVDAGPPTTVEYRLSEGGERLIPVLADLGQWAEENLGS